MAGSDRSSLYSIEEARRVGLHTTYRVVHTTQISVCYRLCTYACMMHCGGNGVENWQSREFTQQLYINCI